jgi:hypothetical protein
LRFRFSSRLPIYLYMYLKDKFILIVDTLGVYCSCKSNYMYYHVHHSPLLLTTYYPDPNLISILQQMGWRSYWCLTPRNKLFSYILARSYIAIRRQWWCLLCSRPTRLQLDINNASLLKQLSIAPLRPIILTPNLSVFVLTL